MLSTRIQVGVFLVLAALCGASADCRNIFNLINETYTGYDVFFRVSRCKLEAKLKEINEADDNDVEFYLPPQQCEDGLCQEDHPIILHIGKITPIDETVDATGFLKQYDIFRFGVPFLNSEPDGSGTPLHLIEDVYTSAEEGTFFINPALEHDDSRKLADVFDWVENATHVSIDLRYGDLRLKVLGQKNDFCAIPTPYVLGTVLDDRYTKNSLVPKPPDFSICDGAFEAIDTPFCRPWRKYRRRITRLGSNVCQRWILQIRGPSCDIPFEILEMSDAFADEYLLDDGHRFIHGSSSFNGVLTPQLIFPCVC